MTIRVCPRCGLPFTYVRERRVNGRVYLYAVHHYKDSSGKVRIRECYLGPKDHYEYVTRLHEKERLILKGLIEQERVLEYIDSLASYAIEIASTNRELAEKILEKLKEAQQQLEQKLHKA